MPNVITDILDTSGISAPNTSLNSSVPSHSPLPPLMPCVYAIAFTPNALIVAVGSVVSTACSASSITGSQIQHTLSSSSVVILLSSLFLITNLMYLSVASVVNSKSALAKDVMIFPLYVLLAVYILMSN